MNLASRDQGRYPGLPSEAKLLPVCPTGHMLRAVPPLSARALVLGFVLVFAVPALARAQGGLPVHAPPGTGQPALSVFAGKGGELVAAACPAAPCSAAPVSLGVPPELRGKPARTELVSIGEGRRAVVVSVDDDARSFRAVVAAPLGAGAPLLVFSGLVGAITGEDGLRTGPMVQVSEAEQDGVKRILVGEQHESISLCGRPTILAPKLLNPKDLKLHAAKVQRLSVAERNGARSVKALRLADDEPSRATPGVLGALAASSAVGAPQALTDDDPETTWSENLGGTGRGEFVVMRAPPELTLAGLELVVRPRLGVVEQAASPERFFIAGPREVVEVTLPEDGWKHPGARYFVPLSPGLRGDCLAVVLDTAFEQGSSARVTLAELSVVSEFSAGELPALVAALAGGGQRAEAAKTLLSAGGPVAHQAVAKAFAGLDEGGRRVALQVIDRADCAVSAPVYVAALTHKSEAQARHAQSRLRRCGPAGGQALAKALSAADQQRLPLLVSELSLTDPARAVGAFLPLMQEKTPTRRRLLRSALAQSARTPQAESAVRVALADPNTSEVALVDLLRALGELSPRFQPEAGAALARLQRSALSFRSRYLLLGPSQALSRVSPEANAFFRRSLNLEPDPHVRASALGLVREPALFQAELLRALGDGEVRVREASARALASPKAGFAAPKLLERLEQDRWPLVRAAAADALALHPASEALDRPLVAALSDESQLVRTRSLRALGQHRAPGVAGRVRERLADADEWPEVRAEAARTLGALCDAESADVLAAFAKKLADPMASPEAQLIGTAAVQALGQLARPDLKEALASLTGKGAPPHVRRSVAAALAARVKCGAAK